jgi:hypothetical protein
VHNIAVGDRQRTHFRLFGGSQPAAFDYNEGPASSCQTFCWKARHRFDVPFFLALTQLQGGAIRAAIEGFAP